MRLYRSLAEPIPGVPIALTIGAFDGVHVGHQRLIEEVRAAAARLGGESAVMTFDPHPDRVLHPERGRLYLTTLEQRVALIESLGVEHLLVLRFDHEMAKVPAETFMERVSRAMDLRELWIGPDFRLGAGGRGTAGVLDQIGRDLRYTVHQVERVRLGDRVVSSTAIREQLGAGRVDEAARLLGRPFAVSGEVVHGDHRGRGIGIPTANIATPAEQFLPADGVYACRAYLPGAARGLPAVANIGARPTFGKQRHTVEAHLLDWSGELYGALLRIDFVGRLRGEQRFDGVDALLAQIHADIAVARDLLGHVAYDAPMKPIGMK